MMGVLGWLIPLSILLGLAGLGAFVWALRDGQFEDLDGDGQRFLADDGDDRPKP